MSNKYEILAMRWFPTNQATAIIGIVAVKDGVFWKAYIGVSNQSKSQEDSIQEIASYGHLMNAEEAHGFFPHMDSLHYKKEEGRQ